MQAQAAAIGASEPDAHDRRAGRCAHRCARGGRCRHGGRDRALKAARPDLDPRCRGVAPAHRATGAAGRGRVGAAGPVAGCDPAAAVRGGPASSPPTADTPSDDPPPARRGRGRTRSEDRRSQLHHLQRPSRHASASDAPPGVATMLRTRPMGEPAGDRTRRPTRPRAWKRSKESGPRSSTSWVRRARRWLQRSRAPVPLSFGEEGLQVAFPPDMTFNKRKAESAEQAGARWRMRFAAVTGQGLRPTTCCSRREAPPDDAGAGQRRDRRG